MTIAAIRQSIEAAHYLVRDLQGHTREEFIRRNVPAVMGAQLAKLDALTIAPRFARDVERREYVRGAVERQIARWTELQPIASVLVQ